MAGRKLLVADDSLTIQKVIRLALSNEGYEIQAVSDGNDAAQQIALFRPNVVLVDVSLPGKSAFELKREINQHADLSEIKFVLMSSAFEKVDETQATETHFHGRLTKPFDPAHLRQILADVLTQSNTPAPPAQMPPKPPSQKTKESGRLPDLPGLTDDYGKITLDPPESLTGSIELGPPEVPENVPLPPLTPMTEDDWLSPIEPEEPPPPPPMNLSMPKVDKPSSGKPESGAGESDIRQLTESTIRMSGLAESGGMPTSEQSMESASPTPPAADDFEWSVNEPTLKPFSSQADTGGSTFQIHPPEPGAGQSAESMSDDATIYNNAPKYGDFSATDSESSTKILHPPNGPSMAMPEPSADNYSFTTDPYAVPIPQKQMDELVRQQVQDTLERMAKTMIPEVAERILKAEIHKLLSEQF